LFSLLPHADQPTLGPILPPIHGIEGALAAGIEAAYSLTVSVKVRMCGAMPPLPYTYLQYYTNKASDYCTWRKTSREHKKLKYQNLK
jgi:hypothetical protein